MHAAYTHVLISIVKRLIAYYIASRFACVFSLLSLSSSILPQVNVYLSIRDNVPIDKIDPLRPHRMVFEFEFACDL